MADYMDEVVTRSAPRWAWEVIDETLEMDANSSAFDKELREQIALALKGMAISCELDADYITRVDCAELENEECH